MMGRISAPPFEDLPRFPLEFEEYTKPEFVQTD